MYPPPRPAQDSSCRPRGGCRKTAAKGPKPPSRLASLNTMRRMGRMRRMIQNPRMMIGEFSISDIRWRAKGVQFQGLQFLPQLLRCATHRVLEEDVDQGQPRLKTGSLYDAKGHSLQEPNGALECWSHGGVVNSSDPSLHHPVRLPRPALFYARAG